MTHDDATDRDAVLAVLNELTAAWARHDAEAFGRQFTEDAVYTTFVGLQYRGRRAIAESHRALWARYLRGTRITDEIVDISFPAPGTALVISRGDTTKGDRPRRVLRKVQTYTLVRDTGGRWLVAAFHNTQRKPFLERLTARVAPT
jgi:uncharacterized protein (TIGR02246 family)